MTDQNSIEQAAKENAEKCQIKYGRDFTQAVDMFKRGAEWMAKRCEELEESAKLAYELLNAKESELAEAKEHIDKCHDKICTMEQHTESDRAALQKAVEALEEIK